MALYTRKVVSDVGSEELKQLRLQVNALLDVIDTAASFAAMQTAVQAGVKKVVATQELPAAPQRPTV